MKKLTFENLSPQHYLIDFRSAEEFAKAHYPGSINVPFSPSLVNWVRSAILAPTSLILISDQEMAESAAEPLQMAGYSVLGFIPFENLQSSGTLETISATELASSNPYIIDVRTSQEWNSGHIKGAHHLELSQFAQKMHEIPKDQKIAVICGGGNRSSVAASLLKKSGYSHVSNVRGGMSAWKQARLPLEA